jgi:hypothetical protein
LNKKYEKVKRRKANIVVAAKDMSTMNGLVWIK